LYNWYAANSGLLAPKGWHVPSDAEWTTLFNYLGGEDVGGVRLSTLPLKHGSGSITSMTPISTERNSIRRWGILFAV
ncbi:MAG: FISUMP domain-containing protein, partial [Mariniphaga sp.]